MAPWLDIAIVPQHPQRVITPSAPAPNRRRLADQDSRGLARPAISRPPAGPTVLT